MILNFLPDMPGRSQNQDLRFIGYWHSVHVPKDKFGVPAKPGLDYEHYEALQATQNALLPRPHEWVDLTWDTAERDMVIAYLKKGVVFETWKGFSWCRFEDCPTKGRGVGHRDFSDAEYVWPESFPHYLEAHGVRPPEEFVAHVREMVELAATLAKSLEAQVEQPIEAELQVCYPQ